MPLKGLNWARFKEHLRKTKWFYIISILVAVLLSNIIYTMTAPRVPSEKEVMIYVVDVYPNVEITALTELAERALVYGQEVDETLESMHFESVQYSTAETDYYAPMVLTARMSVGDGDAYICSKEALDYIMAGAASEEMEKALEEGWMEGLEQIRYEVVDEEGNMTDELTLAGVKLDCADVLRNMGVTMSDDLYLMVAGNSTNIGTSMRVAEYVVRELEAMADGAGA